MKITGAYIKVPVVDGTANVDKVFYHWNDRIMNAVTQADSLKNRAEANYR